MRGLLTFFLIFLCTLSFAQQYVGRVVDGQTREALPGANIFLSNNWRIGTVTNGAGEFVLQAENQSPEESVIISFIGYEDQLITFGNLQGEIYLKVNEKELEIIVVEEQSLAAVEFTYQKIEQLDIYLNPASKADPLLAVASLPSATNADESANISLRGSNSNATGIFFNDVPIYDAVRFSQINGIGTFGIFNTAMIKNIMVFPGNPPLEYGNVSSGLISLSTSESLVAKSSTSVGVGLASFGFFRLQKISNKVSLRFFGNYQPSEILKTFNQESLKSLKTFNSLDFGVLLSTNLSTESSISVFNYSLKEQYEYLFSSPSYKGDFMQNRNRNFSVFNFRQNFEKGKLAINSGLSFSKANYSFSRTEMELKKEDIFLGVNYSKTIGEWDFKIGFSSDGREVEGTGVVPTYDFALANNHPHMNIAFNQTGRANEFFAYAKNYISNKFILGFGLRRNADFKQDYLSAQINMSLELNDRLKVIAGLGRYHRLAFEENTDIKRTLRSDQASLDLKYNINTIKTGISLFVKKEEIDQKRWIKGIEYYLFGQLLPKVTGDISVTLLDIDQPNDLDSERLQEVNYFIKGNLRWLVWDKVNVGVFSIFRQGSQINSILSSTYIDDLGVFEPKVNSEFDRLPNYLSVGVSMSKTFVLTDDLGMIGYLSINNALNRENVRGYSYSPNYESRQEEFFSLRTLYFGVQLSF